MKKCSINLFLVIFLILFSACSVVSVKKMNFEELDEWIKTKFDFSENDKIDTTLTYKSILLTEIADSLGINPIQKIDINRDNTPELIVNYGGKPYLLFDTPREKIVSLRRNIDREIAVHPLTNNQIEVFEVVSYFDFEDDPFKKDSLYSYRLKYVDSKLLEVTPKATEVISRVTYHASTYENRLISITREGGVVYFDYRPALYLDKNINNSVDLYYGEVSNEIMLKLNNLLSIVDFSEIKPQHWDELHVIPIELYFKGKENEFEIKDIGKRGSFALMELYELLDKAVESAEPSFKAMRTIMVKDLYEEGISKSVDYMKNVKIPNDHD